MASHGSAASSAEIDEAAPNTDGDAEAESESDAESDADAESESDAESDADAESESDAESDADAESESDADDARTGPPLPITAPRRSPAPGGRSSLPS
jgi:hypothetical protein